LFFKNGKNRKNEKRSLSPCFFTLIVCFQIFTSPLYAGFETIESDDVVVLYEGAKKGIATEVAGVYPAVKEELVNTLQWDVDFKPKIIIAKDRNTFRKIVGSDIIVAFAVPETNLIVLDISRIYTKPFSLETTLKHELCHLLLHRNIKQDNLPRWLDEGVCQWVSGGVTELHTGTGDRALSEAAVSNNVIRISSLDEFPRDEEKILLAYEESKSFVEYIMSEYGENRLLQTLGYLKEGEPVDESFKRSLSVSFPVLEQKWHAHLKRKYTWFSYVSNNIYTILFFLAGIITLYGFFRLLKKKRDYKDEEEDENI
jgi:hypothetical protein